MSDLDKKVALYRLVTGNEFDKEQYKNIKEAADAEVDDNGYAYEIDGMEYTVYSDSEAHETAVESILELFDDVGVFGLPYELTDWIISYALDEQWFDTAQLESAESYAYDIKDDDSSNAVLYLNRLHEEMVEIRIIDDLEDDDSITSDDVENKIDDFVEEYTKDESGVEWFESNFGKDEMSTVAKNNNLVDENMVAEYMIDTDGLGRVLSSYDDEEHEQDGYLLFRID